MAVAFSSDDAQVLEKQVKSEFVEIGNIETEFEIERSVEWIDQNKYQTVALQFPDCLMKFSPQVAALLESRVNQKVYILGDTSYGECCVDEVAAEHIKADCIIHYGHTCLTPTQRLPVLHIFTVLPLDTEKLKNSLRCKFTNPEKVALVYDVQYDAAIKSLVDYFIASPDVQGLYCGRKWPENIKNQEDWTIVYIGKNANFEILLHLNFQNCSVMSYDIDKDDFVPGGINVSKVLMKRYALIEKTRDSERIGILVGTLGVSRYGLIMDQIRSVVKKSGKRVYTFLVGKPNVPKLANFPEIDTFVLVSCPENSLLDSREFLKPIITPFELDVALNGNREWTGNYEANFRQILPDGPCFCEFGRNQDEDGLNFSLISGKIRTNNEDIEENGRRNELAVQDTRISSLHQMGGGEFLRHRTWQGLEQKIGETAPALVVEGQSGIAWSYQNEAK